MHSPELPSDLTSVVAAAADLCMKPWKHSVVEKPNEKESKSFKEVPEDIILVIKCRSINGQRHPQNDLEIEIYKSGSNLNIIVGWEEDNERPILWQGEHAVWMDANTGKRCSMPSYGDPIEAFARRIRSLFPLGDIEDN